MKVVINIPESQYEYLAKISNNGKEPLGYFERVILRGTPLPKNYGDLVDKDSLIRELDYISFNDSYDLTRVEEIISEEPAVIEGINSNEKSGQY